MNKKPIEAITAAAESAIQEISTMVGPIHLDNDDVERLCSLSRMLDGVILSGKTDDVLDAMASSLRSIENTFFGLRISGVIFCLKTNPSLQMSEMRTLMEKYNAIGFADDVRLTWGVSFDKAMPTDEIHLAILVGFDVDPTALSA